MKIHSFWEKHGYIPLFLALSFFCALPLLFAHPVQRDWNNEKNTSGWAWVGHPTYTVQNGNFNTRSEHQCGILNKTGKKIGIFVGYDHKILRNGSVVADGSYSQGLTVPKPKNKGEHVYFTTSDVPGHYVRTASTPVGPGDYELDVYTLMQYQGNARAKAPHPKVDLIP